MRYTPTRAAGASTTVSAVMLTMRRTVALGVSTLWRNAVSYAEGRRWVETLLARDLSPADRLWALILAADHNLSPANVRDRLEQLRELDKRREAIIASIEKQDKLTPELM